MRPLVRLLLALAALAIPVAPLAADEPPAPLVLTTLSSPKPCGFFRSQAFGKGLTDPATEMLWACEAIATRRAADLRLGVRLEATELALVRYREALIDASRTGFLSSSGRGPSPSYPSDAEKRAVAEATGILAALMAISGGY